MDDLDFEKLKASVAEQTESSAMPRSVRIIATLGSCRLGEIPIDTGAQMFKPKTCRSTHSSNLSAEPT